MSTSLKNQPRSDTPSISTNKRKRTFVEHGISSLSPSCDNTIKSPGLSQKKSRLMDLSTETHSSSNGLSRVTDIRQGTSPLLFASSSSPLRPVPASSETFSGTAANVRPQEKQTPRRHPSNFAVPPFPPPSYSRRRPSAINLTGSSVEQSTISTTSSAAPLMSVPTGLFAVRSHTNVSMHGNAPKLQGQPSTPSFFGLTPTAARPPRVLRVHTSLAAGSGSNSVASVPESRAALATSIGNTLKDPDLFDHIKDHPNTPRNGERNPLQNTATQSGGKGTTFKSTTPELTSEIGRLTRSNTRALNALGFPLPPQPSFKEDKKCDVVVATLAPPRPPQPSIKETVAHNVKNKPITTDPLVKGKHIARHVLGKAKRRSPVVRSSPFNLYDPN